jgi:hypothetical protein
LVRLCTYEVQSIQLDGYPVPYVWQTGVNQPAS